MDASGSALEYELLPNVKVKSTLQVETNVDRGVEVEIICEHRKQRASGCCRH